MSTSKSWRHCLWMAPLSFALALPEAGAQSGSESLQIEEVVVSARKREENLQDVPLAVTAINATEIQRQGIKSVEEVIGKDPSLSFDLGIAPYDTRIVIRGLSPTRGRPNVATLVDGIDISSESIGTAGGSLLINPRLVDVERIEVVKGPQSALYGRSAFAGAIQYISKDPSDDLDGDLAVEAGNHGRYDVKGSLSMPFTEDFGIRLNGYRFEDRGYYKNSVTGGYVGGGEGIGGSLTAKWTPGERYSLKFRADYADDSFGQQAQALLPFNGTTAVPAEASSCRVYSIVNPANNQTVFALGPVIDPSCATITVGTAAPVLNPVRRLETAMGNQGYFNDMVIRSYRGAMPDGKGLQVALNPDYSRTFNGIGAPDFPGSNRQVTRLSAVQELQFGYGTFSSYTGYTRGLAAANFDFDKSASTSIFSSLDTDGLTEQFSQELRFTSDFDGPLQVIGGLQYWPERAEQEDRNFTVLASGITCVITSPVSTTCPPPAFGTGFTSTSVAPYMDDVAAARPTTFTGRKVDHQSVYLELEWAVTDTLQLIAEARYVDEDNTVTGAYTGGTAAAPAPGTGAAGTVTLCGTTGSCANTAAIPYPAAPGSTLRTFAGATVTGYGSYKRNDSYVTPKGTIQWRPRDNLNLYASYAQAEKPGGFSTLQIGAAGLGALDGVEFLPEKMKVYEAGAKWTSDNRRLRVNGTYFLQDFTDKQVGGQVLIGNILANRISNAGGARLQGLELATDFRATEHLSLALGLTYFLEYEYTKYETPITSAGELARVGNCTPLVTLAATGTSASVACIASRTGNKLEDTPELAAAFNASYRRPLGGSGLSWFADLDTTYTGKRYEGDDNALWVEANFLTNLRLGVESSRWSALVYVDNVADDRTIRSAGTGPGTVVGYFRVGQVIAANTGFAARQVFAPQFPTPVFVDLPNPRTYGLRVNYRF